MNKRKPCRYWKNPNTLKYELELIIKHLGYFPTQTELNKLGRSDITNAIKTHHHGYRAVRKLFNTPLLRKEDGYWEKVDNLKIELEQIVEKLGHFPSQKELEEIGRGDIGSAIRNHHQGYRAVRKLFNTPQVKMKDGYWKNQNNLRKELKPIINKLGHFPTHRELNNLHRQDIAGGIISYGGYGAVRKLFNAPDVVKKKGYWRDFENLRDELELIINKLGHFPSQRELNELGISGASGAIKYHGGVYMVREKIGYNEKMSRQLAKELEEIVREYE